MWGLREYTELDNKKQRTDNREQMIEKKIMNKVIEIIKKKPVLFLAVSVGYAIGVGILKWKIVWPPQSNAAGTFDVLPQAFLYLSGAILGVYFLDGAEVFFALTPSPFRSIVFMAAYAVVSFFVVTSSGSFLGAGLVLSLYLSLLLWQIGELGLTGNLNSWYRMVAGVPTVIQQKWILAAMAAVFFIETYLFIR